MSARVVAAVLALLCAAPLAAHELARVAPKPVEVAVQDRQGRDHQVADLKGKITLLHFWASWCASCREEFAALQALQKDMGPEGLKIVAVSVDRLGWPTIEATLGKLGVRDLAVFHDRNRAAALALGVVGLPTTLALDGAGREVARMQGAGAWGDPALRRALREAASLSREQN